MDNIRICCVSDTHGFLPDIPVCDLLLIAGDICPATDHSKAFQECWFRDNFLYWLRRTPAKEKIFIAGNHDFIFERNDFGKTLHYQLEDAMRTDRSIRYLQDRGITYQGLKIWGTPWQPWFYAWAFNLYEPDLAKKWDMIPEDTDIIVVHGPPHGCGDKVRAVEDEEEWPGFRNCGSPSLLKRIESVKPKLVVCGHIHPGYGIYRVGDTVVVNASYVDQTYKPKNPIVQLEYNRETKTIFSDSVPRLI